MDENKNIENKIKESFDALNKSAKADLWSKLSDKLSAANIDESIDKKIKNGFENKSNAVPPRVWGSVNRQLNVDRVWKRISKELDRRPIIIFWRKMAMVIALILLFFSGSLYVIKNNDSSSPFSQQMYETQKNKQTAKSGLSNLTTSSISVANKKITSNNVTETSAQTRNVNAKMRNEERNSPGKYSNDKSNIAAGNNSTSTILIEKSKVEFSEASVPKENDSISFTTLIPININLKDSAIASELILQPLSLVDNTFKQPLLNKKRFEVGITYSYNNTWIINNNTRSSFDENSLIQSVAAYAGSYGLIANYGIFKNSAISTEFYINSKYIQKYAEFAEGTFNKKTNELNYYKLAFLYQFNINQSPYRIVPSKYTFKAGFYGSYLKNHTYNYTNVMSPKTDSYTKAGYGARIAIGQEKTVKRVIIGYGLNAEYDFKNIFEGNRQVSSQFNVSRNALIGGYVNLKYSF